MVAAEAVAVAAVAESLVAAADAVEAVHQHLLHVQPQHLVLLLHVRRLHHVRLQLHADQLLAVVDAIQAAVADCLAADSNVQAS